MVGAMLDRHKLGVSDNNLGSQGNPQTMFYNGFPREDLRAVAQLVLGFAGYVVAGGLMIRFIGRVSFENLQTRRG